MSRLTIISDADFEAVFACYPNFVRERMLHLRELILETARETDAVSTITEALKWNEPSFITKIGSPVRIDWKERSPNEYDMYFQCTSRLVETFRQVFENEFQYEGNRAIRFDINQEIPEIELKQCIKAALTYHKVKKLSLLGI